MTDWVGQVLGGRYEVTAKLGEGGMGTVYRARDRHLDCDVVVKAPRRVLLDDPGFAGRFDREVRALVRLAHPHVVKVTDVGCHDGLPFAVLQYLSGGSLRDRQRAAGGGRRLFAPAELAGWLPAVAAALDFIHEHHFLHRDVKPDNILFDEHGHAYLSDFGVAKALAAGDAPRRRQTVLTGAGMVLGTPGYMAPELILGRPCDRRVDQYALAVVVYELLSGRLPFDGPTPTAVFVQHTTAEPARLEGLLPAGVGAAARAVHRALSKDPRQRFPTCAAFAHAVLEPAPRPVPATATNAATNTAANAATGAWRSTTDPVPEQVPAEATPARREAGKEAGGAVPCPHCGKPSRVPPAFAGKKVRCPACARSFVAPGPARQPATDAPTELVETPPIHQAQHDTEPNPQQERLPSRLGSREDPATEEGATETQRRSKEEKTRASEPRRHEGRGRLLVWSGVLAVLAVSLLMTGIVFWPYLSQEQRPHPELPPAAQTPTDPPDLVDLGPAEPLDNKEYVRIDFNDRLRRGEGGIVGKIPVNMAFGLSPTDQFDPRNPNSPKLLTYDRYGRTNNTCVLIDGRPLLFGDDGEWTTMSEPLPEPRQGRRSVWQAGRGVEVVQEVELIRGDAGKLDACLVRYLLTNRDSQSHDVGIRFLLDTCIGITDGVPFTLPGSPDLCDTLRDFRNAGDVPDYIEALENENLQNPGTVAHLRLKLGNKVEAPSRVLLGAWPDPNLSRVNIDGALGPFTRWNVPVASMKLLHERGIRNNRNQALQRDSAVTLYWEPRPLAQDETRVVGFTYGLGRVASGESKGKLLLTTGGRLVRGGEFTLTALVANPGNDETLTLELPSGLRRLEGDETRPVPPVPAGSARPISTLSWRLAADRAGAFSVRVRSGHGTVETITLKFLPQGVFDGPRPARAFLKVPAEGLRVEVGKSGGLRIDVDRIVYPNGLRLIVRMLPPGLTAPAVEVPPSERQGVLPINAAANAAAGTYPIEVVALDGVTELDRIATVVRVLPAQPRRLPPELEAKAQAAVEKGLDFLRSQQRDDGTFPAPSPNFSSGSTFLAGLTLRECGVPATDTRLQKLTGQVRAFARSTQATKTYEVALALLYLDRVADPADQPLIQSLGLRLLAGQRPGGGWSYDCPDLSAEAQTALLAALRRTRPQAAGELIVRDREGRLIEPSGKILNEDGLDTKILKDIEAGYTKLLSVQADLKRFPELARVPSLRATDAPPAGTTEPPRGGERSTRVGIPRFDFQVGREDNSNTQFAALGLWAASRNDVPCERSLALLGARFRATHNASGGWGYVPSTRETPAMTCAGLLALALGHGVRIEYASQKRDDSQISAALGFLAKSLNQDDSLARNPYFLWSLARVGVLFGLEKVGETDWYEWGVRQLVASQEPQGAWTLRSYHGTSALHDTCFALLFLKKSSFLPGLSGKIKRFLDVKGAWRSDS